MADSRPTEQHQDISVLLGSHTGQPKKFVFPVGLEGLTADFGNRAVTTQALDQFWCDALGPAVPTLSLTGHTGWRILRDNRDGKQQFAYLLQMHLDHMGLMAQHPNSPLSLLLLHDPTTGLTMQCFATNLRITRDKTRALFYQFQWDLTVVKQFAITNSPSQNWRVGRSGTGYVNLNPPATTAHKSRSEQARRIQTAGGATIPSGVTAYTVQAGDTLDGLVTAFYHPTSQSQRQRAMQTVLSYPRNSQITNPNAIYVGEVIYFPKRIS
jgi:hypothetical protein